MCKSVVDVGDGLIKHRQVTLLPPSPLPGPYTHKTQMAPSNHREFNWTLGWQLGGWVGGWGEGGAAFNSCHHWLCQMTNLSPQFPSSGRGTPIRSPKSLGNLTVRFPNSMGNLTKYNSTTNCLFPQTIGDSQMAKEDNSKLLQNGIITKFVNKFRYYSFSLPQTSRSWGEQPIHSSHHIKKNHNFFYREKYLNFVKNAFFKPFFKRIFFV